MAKRAIAEQLTLDLLFDDVPEKPMPTPGCCQFERSHILVGEKPKSRCGFRGTEVWTNCRECRRCVWDGWQQQGALDGLKMAGGDYDDDCC